MIIRIYPTVVETFHYRYTLLFNQDKPNSGIYLIAHNSCQLPGQAFIDFSIRYAANCVQNQNKNCTLNQLVVYRSNAGPPDIQSLIEMKIQTP